MGQLDNNFLTIVHNLIHPQTSGKLEGEQQAAVITC